VWDGTGVGEFLSSLRTAAQLTGNGHGSREICWWDQERQAHPIEASSESRYDSPIARASARRLHSVDRLINGRLQQSFGPPFSGFSCLLVRGAYPEGSTNVSVYV
jgi:hypothetical protein